MGMATAITAFSQRGARRGQAFGFLLYSGLLTALLLGLAAWVSPFARADDLVRLKLAGTAAAVAAAQWPEWTTLGLAGVFSGLVLALAGFVLAPAMVASAVAQERRAGTLDQLRMTPLSSLQLALGFVVGVPARLYLMCAGPLVVHIAATLAGPAPLWLLPGTLGLLVIGTATSCAVGLCVALAPRQESAGALAALAVAAGLAVMVFTTGMIAACSSVTSWAMWNPAGGLSALLQSQPTLWRRMVTNGAFDAGDRGTVALGFVAVASLVASLTLGVLLFRAACRRLAAPQLPLLSKPQALIMFGLALTMLMVPFLDGRTSFDAGAAAALTFLLLPLVALLGMQTTPTFEAWAIARRRGRRPGWRADDAAPHRVMWLMEAAWGAVLVVRFGTGWAAYLPTLPAVWTALTALTLPVYVLFAGTRYSSPAGRSAFAVAIGMHLATQIFTICAFNHGTRGEYMVVFVVLGAITAVVVPASVAWRQHVMARALTAG
jgi:hypothetical protein